VIDIWLELFMMSTALQIFIHIVVDYLVECESKKVGFINKSVSVYCFINITSYISAKIKRN
jgi:hypothetical protein